jgi:hypothetical protein
MVFAGSLLVDCKELMKDFFLLKKGNNPASAAMQPIELKYR